MNQSSTFSLAKKYAAGAMLDATAVTALAAVSTSTTVVECLDMLSAAVQASHPVAANNIGKATSVEA